jgi:hypothetical protein
MKLFFVFCYFLMKIRPLSQIAAALICSMACHIPSHCLAADVSLVGNTDPKAQGAAPLLDSLGNHTVSDIKRDAVLSVEGRVLLNDATGPELECTELRIDVGSGVRSPAALYVRKVLLRVLGDVSISSKKGADATLALEQLSVFRWAGTMKLTGANARLSIAGKCAVEGGSLDIASAKVRLIIQTKGMLEKVFSENRSALISVEREFTISADSIVQVTLEKEVVNSNLSKGEFIIVRSATTSGEVPQLEITGISPEQAARVSLKLDEKGLKLIVAAVP